MATGADVKTQLLVKIGEFGLGYFDDSRLNSFLSNAVTDTFDKKIEQFQKDRKVTRELQIIINSLSGLTPTNATIDISQGSTQVPDFYSPINIQVTSPYRGSSITKTAEERQYSKFIDPNTIGDARYPRYINESTVIRIEPSDATAVQIDYFTIPVAIDVTDSSTQVPYNNKLIQRIIDNVIGIIGFEERDDFSMVASNQMQQINP